MFRCDYFDGQHYCSRQFRTTFSGMRAIQEIRTYGWSLNTDGEIRCPEHRTTVSEPLPSTKEKSDG